ncbi:hypothetical protein EVA_07224 [gut metagenome]|uniref:Uncharacterized protein n=1 Tax=gut metagenome TaxID=749906 RepID=J9GBH7_9ZZZZ
MTFLLLLILLFFSNHPCGEYGMNRHMNFKIYHFDNGMECWDNSSQTTP